MSQYVARSGKVFRLEQDLIDATCLSRPDPEWKFVDSNVHLHQWYVGDKAAETYDPSLTYTTPTLHRVVDRRYFDVDLDDWIEESHSACRFCNEPVVPGTTADQFRQYRAGLKHCFIDGVEVSEEEFNRQLAAEQSITLFELLSVNTAMLKTLDGKYAPLIVWRDPAGFQVYEEEEIRWIPLKRLRIVGRKDADKVALEELPE